MSTLDRHRKAEAVFLAVSERPPEAWQEALHEGCGGDPALLAEVRGLLEAHAKAEGFLDAAELIAPSLGFFGRRGGHEDAELCAGTRVGVYTVERVLGVGGMGTVYLARQERPGRKVALKVIRRGYSSTSLLRRFEHEAEVLGRLHHPGIAQIYEAGAASMEPGRPAQPYIAMELVSGPSLSEHVERERLSTHERLELLAKICDAVHHAHQRGVIHRDLKPGNILVDERGQPKVLDFGVARASDADLRVTTMQTSVGQLIGTLPYMSPEQVLADPSEVDLRSDVYALGVILFQLLAGKLPHDLGSRSIPEAARIIREEAPSKLSSVSRVFRGDLDTIVSKALEKDKARRYQSAADLADDLRRYVGGMPIAAKQDSALYVFAKQVRRHRLAAVGIAAMLAGLVVFAAYAGAQARRFSRLAEEKASLAESESGLKKQAQEATSLAQVQAERANAQAKQFEEQLFTTSIERARLEGLAGNPVGAEDLLWRAYFSRPSSLRGRWALWEYYERNPCLWTRVAHNDVAARMALSPAGLIATCTFAGEIAFFDGTDGGPVARWSGCARGITELAFSRDGSSLVGLTRQGEVVSYPIPIDGIPGEPPSATVKALARGATIDAMALAPGADRVVLHVRDGPVSIFDAATGERLADIPLEERETLATVALSAKGGLLATGTKLGSVSLWDLAKGRRLWTTGAHNGLPWSLIISPGEDYVISSSRERRIVILDARDGRQTGVMSPELNSTRRLDVSPDGRFLLSADAGALHVWSLPDGRPVREMQPHRGGATDARWSPEGHRMVSIGRDGRLRAWEPTALPGTRVFEGHTSWVFAAAFSPDGRHVATAGGEGAVRVWTHDGECVRTIQLNALRCRIVLYSPDGARLFAACTDGKVHVLDPASGEELGAIDLPTPSEGVSLAFSPDGKVLVAGGISNRVGVYDASTLALTTTLVLPRSGGIVNSLVFSPDGGTLYCDGNAHEVCEWDTASWSLRTVLPAPGIVRTLSIDRENLRLAAGTEDGQIALWSMSTRTPLGTIRAHATGVYGLEFSPTGKTLVSGSDDASVKLWEPSAGTLLVTLTPHKGECPWVSFSPDGHRLCATFRDRAMITWDLLHYNLNIAGNMNYQYERLKGELEPGVDVGGALRWAEAMRRQVPLR